MEKALPMFVLAVACIFATATVFGILCGNMIRARRKIEKLQREREEQQEHYPAYTVTPLDQNAVEIPGFKQINDTNQSASINNPEQSSSSYTTIAFDRTFKAHPHPFLSIKRIVQL